MHGRAKTEFRVHALRESVISVTPIDRMSPRPLLGFAGGASFNNLLQQIIKKLAAITFPSLRLVIA